MNIKKNKYRIICPNCGTEHKTTEDAYKCMIKDININANNK